MHSPPFTIAATGYLEHKEMITIVLCNINLDKLEWLLLCRALFEPDHTIINWSVSSLGVCRTCDPCWYATMASARETLNIERCMGHDRYALSSHRHTAKQTDSQTGQADSQIHTPAARLADWVRVESAIQPAYCMRSLGSSTWSSLTAVSLSSMPPCPPWELSSSTFCVPLRTGTSS